MTYKERTEALNKIAFAAETRGEEALNEAHGAMGKLRERARAEKFRISAVLMWLDEIETILDEGHGRPGMPALAAMLDIVGDWEEGK